MFSLLREISSVCKECHLVFEKGEQLSDITMGRQGGHGLTGNGLGFKFSLFHITFVGIAAISDSAVSSQYNDGRTQWEWQVLGLEGSSQGY